MIIDFVAFARNHSSYAHITNNDRLAGPKDEGRLRAPFSQRAL